MSYPISLDLTGRRVVVVGGGAVATRRVRGLVAAGADVLVIAPAISAEIHALDVSIAERSYVDGDLAEAWFAQACTDEPAVNDAVSAEAERLRIPCVRADLVSAGTARTPAVARSGPVTVAVTADDPSVSRDLTAAISALLDTGELSAKPRRTKGSVALVGGGPGDPELITVRGRRLLAAADVVVADRLGPRDLLDTVTAEIVDVGKTPYKKHGATQQEINDLLVERARRGQAVVRLKGGDPFVFGRGGEEVAACVAAGIPVQVVPGVTSAVAGPSAAGIPLTHRGIAADFTVVSAHLAAHSAHGSARGLAPHGPSTVDWDALARGSSTLVVLMGMERLELLSKTLIAGGRNGATPAAVVQNATLPDQRVLVSTLDSLAADAKSAGMGSPAVVVIGEVVKLRV